MHSVKSILLSILLTVVGFLGMKFTVEYIMDHKSVPKKEFSYIKIGERPEVKTTQIPKPATQTQGT